MDEQLARRIIREDLATVRPLVTLSRDELVLIALGSSGSRAELGCVVEHGTARSRLRRPGAGQRTLIEHGTTVRISGHGGDRAGRRRVGRAGRVAPGAMTTLPKSSEVIRPDLNAVAARPPITGLLGRTD